MNKIDKNNVFLYLKFIKLIQVALGKTMKKNGFLIFYFFLASNKMIAQPSREIIGYYPAWQWYDRGQLVRPETIRYNRYTIINYAFFKPNLDGTLEGTDAWADENLLEGEIRDWSVSPKTHIPNTSLVALAHKAGVKVLISIGGWTLSNNFPKIAANDSSRQKFVNECRRLIKKYNIDGVDIDWEYPGYAEHGGSSADKNLFTKLITDIRQNFDDLTKETSKTYLLTAAFGASAINMDNIDWAAVTPKLHSINLMTYDFSGTWSGETGHNAPLFAPDDNSSDGAVKRLIETYNVPSSKICMGIAFYGRSVKTKTTPILRGAITGKADKTIFRVDDGAPMFYSVLTKKKYFVEHWDSVAQVPYLTGKNTLKTFVSYDNQRSVALKAQYIVDKDLLGTILWDLTGDYVATKKVNDIVVTTPLIDTINRIFNVNKKVVTYTTTLAKPLPVDKNLVKEVKVNHHDMMQVATVDTIETTPSQQTQTAEISNTDTTNIKKIDSTTNSTTSTDFLDFKINSDETINISITFDLKQKREVIIQIKSLDSQILRGQPCGILDVGNHTINLTEIFVSIPAAEYWIELSLPAFDVVPEDKVTHKWVKKP
jgi:GH18 family chitinase